LDAEAKGVERGILNAAVAYFLTKQGQFGSSGFVHGEEIAPPTRGEAGFGEHGWTRYTDSR